MSRCLETNQPLRPHQAGVAKQIRADLALLERRQVNTIDVPRPRFSANMPKHRTTGSRLFRLFRCWLVGGQSSEGLDLHQSLG
jgi:hypothetical protein